MKKNTSIELIRIIAMLMIVTLHCNLFSTKVVWSDLSKNTLFSILEIVSIIAVNLYILITGFFLGKSKFSFKKIAKLELIVIFYSVSIYILLSLTGLTLFRKQTLLRLCFPVINGNYWFYSCYFVLYLILPLLKKVYFEIKKVGKERLLITVLVILVSLIPSINPTNNYLKMFSGYSYVWFIVLVFIGAYLRDNYEKFDLKKIGILYSVILIFQILLYYSGNVFNKIFWLNSWHGFLLSYNNILVLINSICMFIMIMHIKVNNRIVSNIINFISSSTFSIYLIHLHPEVTDPILSKMFDISKYSGTAKIYYYYFGLIFFIFIGCMLIDKVRVLIFKLLGKNMNKLNNKMNFIDKKISLECD